MRHDFTGVTWRKSSASNGTQDCVETARVHGVTGVRDSKDRDGAVLTFDGRAWADFLGGVRAGHFD